MAQKHHCHIDFTFFHRAALLGEFDRVFLLDDNIVEHRNDAEYGNTTNLFHQFSTFVEQTQVATKLVNYYTLDTLAVLRSLQHNRAVGTGKHSATVNVCHKYDIGIGMARHRHVHKIGVAQIKFRHTTRSFHHNRIVFA